MIEIRNPVKLPTGLYPAEKEFARCLAAGERCMVGNGELPKPEERIESGDGANVVRGEVIRFFAYGGNEENPILGPIIHLHGAWISEGLDLAHASISYMLAFSNCHFGVSVMMLHMECAGLYLNGSCLAKGLIADGLTTKGSVYLRDGFSAEGEVRLLNANISGNLDCAGGKFYNPGEYALSVDELTVKGSVILRNGFSAEGEVRFLGANIGGNLDCENGKFNNANGRAFSADRLTTKGNVHFKNDFFVKGEVRLLGANIGGNLDCENGKFNNANGMAFLADRLTTKGNVHFKNGFSAKGEVRFACANIGGNLDCTGGQFNNLNGTALAVEGSNINASLFWRSTTCKGGVNLAYARADVLSDDLNSWKSCKVILDGFTYNRFAKPMDAQSRIDWLAKRPDGILFSSLPYEQTAKVLFGMGHAYDARKILLEKERLQTKEGKMHWLRKVGRRLWDVFAGYGYRLSYTAAWIVFFIVSGAAIFDVADRYSNIVPTHPVVALSDGYKMEIASNGMRPTQAVPSEYPAFNPLVFSLDVFTPSAVFHQEDSWGPRSGGGDWLDFDFDVLWLLTLWYWVEVAMGWILTSMLLLSVTGLLRPRQSSGERD